MAAPIARKIDTHPEPYIHHPLGGKHTHTLILLHGTSQTGPTFASALLSFRFTFPFPVSSSSSPLPTLSEFPPNAKSPDAKTYTIQELLPTTKLIFPSGSAKPLTVFHGAPSHAWFDIHNFADRTVGEADQVRGMRESAAYLSGLIAVEEEKLLGKDGVRDGGQGKEGSRVAVLGFSQGCAMGIVMALAGLLESTGHGSGSESEKERAHAAPVPFIGLSGWLPFRIQVEGCLAKKESVREYIHSLLDLPLQPGSPSHPNAATTISSSLVRTKQQIHLAHGARDVKVKLEWAKQMVEALECVDESQDIGMGLQVEARVYEGLAHWFNEAETAGVVAFLARVWGANVLCEATRNERREREANAWRRMVRRAKFWGGRYCERGLKRKTEKSVRVS